MSDEEKAGWERGYEEASKDCFKLINIYIKKSDNLQSAKMVLMNLKRKFVRDFESMFGSSVLKEEKDRGRK